MQDFERTTNSPRRSSWRRAAWWVALASLFLGASPGLAASFTAGNLVVVRVGAGASALTSAATAVFLDEYTPAGVLVQSLALPTAASGDNKQLTLSGTASSEGLLTRSVNGDFLVVAGYDAAPGTAGVTTSTSAGVNRVVARVNAFGGIDTRTAFGDAISGGNPRGVASTDGANLWISGTSSGGGIRYGAFAGTTSTSLATSPTNIRAAAVFGGQLYVTSASGTFQGVAAVGSGTPTTTGQTVTLLPGFPTTSGPSPYAFVILDRDAGVAGLDTIYLADDRPAASGGGIQKWHFDGSAWILKGAVSSGTTGLRGLSGFKDASGNAVLFATTTQTSANQLVTITDSAISDAPVTGSFSTVASAPTNTVFRGVASAPAAAVSLPGLSLNDVSLNEGNAGTTSFTFTVSLSAPAGAGGVTFDIATADGTASSPTDYTAQSLSSQTIPSGSSTYSFTVLVNGDTTPEVNETFFVNVTNVSGATVTDGQGQGSVVNDDAAPDLTVNDVTVSEGNSGTTAFTFTVGLSTPAPSGGVTFDIATANGTASSSTDYGSNVLTGQTIPPGSSTYSFTVLVNGDSTPEPNETFFVNVTNATNAIVLDGQGQGTIQNDDYTPIHDIQGDGASSPLSGVVTTRGIVTALKLSGSNPNGFFLQTPDAGADADPVTSEGVFVFTSAVPPPSVVVGNEVAVTGTISEFVPSADPLQPPLTEIVSPSITLLSTGNPLPTPVTLTSTFPDPTAPYDQLEAVEGMRVTVPSLTVVAPTGGSISETNSTATADGVFFGVVTGVARPFREPGIQAPDPAPSGSIPPIPRFDTNPERIRVDSDRQPGTSALDLSTGTVLTSLTGVLDYSNRAYTLLPDPGSPASMSGGATGTTVTTPAGNEVTVASMNVRRFFDTTNDPSTSDVTLTSPAYSGRLAKTSMAIRENLRFPDIIGLQEVENLGVLQNLAARISADAIAASQPDPLYEPYLIEGNDIGGIDVGYLVKTAEVAPCLPRVVVGGVVQEEKTALFLNPNSTTELLHDRPHLRLMATVNFPGGEHFDLTVVNVHLRSLGSVAATTPGSNGWVTDGERVRAKRQKQAESVANLVQARQTANPAERIVVLGDFNAFEINDGYGHSVGVIKGTPVPDDETAVPGDGIDLVNPDLTDLASSLPAEERYSYSFDGNAQTLDQLLGNAPLLSDAVGGWRVEHARINADFTETKTGDFASALRISDHDPSVAYFGFLAGPPVVGGLAVTNVTSVSADVSADVTFDGGASVTGRGFVYAKAATNPNPELGGLGVTTVYASGTTGPMAATLQSLAGSTDYAVRGFATNDAGTGYSPVSGVTTDYPTAPGAPSITGITPDLGSLEVSFDPPETDGGSPITGYTATCGLESQAGSASPILVAGLVGGVAVSCTVHAENMVGPGPESAPSTAVAPAALCAAGSFSLNGLDYPDACTPASPGHFVAAPGATAESECLAGSYQPGSGQASCLLASPGFYVPLSGASSQIPCGAGYTSSQGATSCTYSASLSITGASVLEGNFATRNLVFTVTRTDAALPATFSYSTAAGTATAGVDYVSKSGTGSFVGASLTTTVSVVVNGDTTTEADEMFSVNLTSATGASILNGTAVGTILNDDAVTLSIGAGAVTEGNAGTRQMTFKVTRNGSSDVPVTFSWGSGPSQGTATGGASCGGGVDFIPPSGTGAIPGGGGTTPFTTISVTTCGDTLSEADETFSVALSNVTGATISGTGAAVGTIVDDDERPMVSIDRSASANEGSPLTVNVTLTAAPGRTVTLQYTFNNQTGVGAGTCGAGADYSYAINPTTGLATATGVLTFVEGAPLTQTLTVPTCADAVVDPNETFSISISAVPGTPVNALFLNQLFTGTIR